jgi:hypothetical protein
MSDVYQDFQPFQPVILSGGRNATAAEEPVLSLSKEPASPFIHPNSQRILNPSSWVRIPASVVRIPLLTQRGLPLR